MRHLINMLVTSCALVMTHPVYAQEILKSKSIVLNEGVCSSIQSLNDGANPSAAIILTSISEGGADAHMEAVSVSLTRKVVVRSFLLPQKNIFETRDMIALEDNSLVALVYKSGQNYGLVELDKAGIELKNKNMTTDLNPVGLLRISSSSFAVFGSLNEKAALLFFDQKLNLERTVVLDQVEEISSILTAILLPDNNLLLNIKGKKGREPTDPSTATLMKVSKQGKVEKVIHIDAEDLGIAANRSGEMLVTFYRKRNGEVNAIALGLGADLSTHWERILYRQIYSVFRVASAPLETGWLVFGSQALHPNLYRINDKGDTQSKINDEGLFAAPSISFHLKNFDRSILAVQENKPMSPGKPISINRCGGIRIDFWDEVK
jgi:hypothetical protein